MPRTDITTALFDLDGTLIDSETIWIEAIQAALAAKGIQVTIEDVTRIEYGRAWKEIYRDIHSRWPDAYPTIQEMEAFTVAYYERVTATRDISIPGSVALLKRLATEGYVVGIVTGSTRERIAAVIKKLELAPYVKGYVGGEDYPNGKPAPDGYLAGARLLGAHTDQCIAFEDAPAGIASAKAAGMVCVAFFPPQRGTEPAHLHAALPRADARHGEARAPSRAQAHPDLVLSDLAEFTFDMLP